MNMVVRMNYQIKFLEGKIKG